MGTPELFVLLGIPLLFILPVWLSLKIYKDELRFWRQLSCLASILASWPGFIIVRSIHQARKGYEDQRRQNLKP
jgi:hypothetical protein